MIVVACVGMLLLADADSGRIRCDDGRVVAFRLHGLDAPETGPRAACAAERALGRAARAAARAAFGDARVALPVAAYRDRFGRAVGDPVLVDVAGQPTLGEALAARGLVAVWDYDGRAPKPDWCG